MDRAVQVAYGGTMTTDRPSNDWNWIQDDVGRKNDGYDGHSPQKARWSLIPWWILENVVRVLTAGASEHGDRGWLTLPNGRERIEDAFMRHWASYKRGELHDPKTREHPLDHCLTNLIMLRDLDRK